MVVQGAEFEPFAMFGSADKAEAAEYILGKRKSRSKTIGSLDIGSVTSKINDDLHLVRWYLVRWYLVRWYLVRWYYEPKDEPEK